MYSKLFICNAPIWNVIQSLKEELRTSNNLPMIPAIVLATVALTIFEAYLEKGGRVQEENEESKTKRQQ